MRGRPTIIPSSQSVRIAYPVMEEVFVARILDRHEFRALCDEAKTRSCGDSPRIAERGHFGGRDSIVIVVSPASRIARINRTKAR